MHFYKIKDDSEVRFFFASRISEDSGCENVGNGYKDEARIEQIFVKSL